MFINQLRNENAMRDEKLHWIRYGMYFEMLVLIYFALLFGLKALNIELSYYRDYVLYSYSIVTYPGLFLAQMMRQTLGSSIALIAGVGINLLIYFLVGAMIGLLVWTIKRYRTDEEF